MEKKKWHAIGSCQVNFQLIAAMNGTELKETIKNFAEKLLRFMLISSTVIEFQL